jgi:hypothetical protein
MNDTDKIYTDAKRFASMFAGFIQAAEKWKDIASLHKAESDAHDRVHKLQAEIKQLTTERDKLKAEYRADVENEMAAARKTAEDYAHHLISRVNKVQSFSRGE